MRKKSCVECSTPIPKCRANNSKTCSAVCGKELKRKALRRWRRDNIEHARHWHRQWGVGYRARNREKLRADYRRISERREAKIAAIVDLNKMLRGVIKSQSSEIDSLRLKLKKARQCLRRNV